MFIGLSWKVKFSIEKMAQRKRLSKELRECSTNPHPRFSLYPDKQDIFSWTGVIMGANGTPYFGGTFEVSIKITKEYPFKPPRVRFVTRVFHPNISLNGSLDVFHDNWSPALTLPRVVESVLHILENPNPDSPLNYEAADLYIRNREQYEANVVEYTQLYAIT